MTRIEQQVASHYARGSLQQAIVDGLKAMGRDGGPIRLEDLAGVDEFHMGGHQATVELADGLGLDGGMHLLDVGSGIGGPARYFAHRFGCRVTGIDLTPDYVSAAQWLTQQVGLGDRVAFQAGSALDMPFEDGQFDAATLIHVGMNIEDKARLFAELHRLVKPGGCFGLYDVMRAGDGDIAFPVPWADSEATSFLARPADYRQGLAAAGFEVATQRNQAALAIAFFERLRARMAEQGPPPLGLHVLMGPEAGGKLANMIAQVQAGRIAPIEMICRRL